ncbi:hypothetical protein SRABI80_02111 [Peribacillus frigoritolerans]|nr:hypothetical protein SRABI80_02111 [Peribacillus frigoritolerans]
MSKKGCRNGILFLFKKLQVVREKEKEKKKIEK